VYDNRVNNEFRGLTTLSAWQIFLRSEDVYLACTLRLPERSNGRAIVYSHGWGGGRENGYHADLLDDLCAHGYTTLSLDHRGYGESTSQKDLAKWPVDLSALVDYLASRDLAVWVAGLSTGGTMAISTASQHPVIKGAVALSPFASLSRLVQDKPEHEPTLSQIFGGLTPAMDAAANAYEKIAAIAPRPVLLVHGSADSIIPSSHSIVLYEVAGQPKDLWIIPDAEHTLTNVERASLFDRLRSWLDRW
jgi:uncharacterized protein